MAEEQTNNKRKGKGYRTKIILLCVRVFIGFMGVSHGFTLYIIVWSGVIKNTAWSMVGSWGFQRTRDWKTCTTQKLTLFWTLIFSLGRSTVSNKSSMLHHVPKVSHPIPLGLSHHVPQSKTSNGVFHSNGDTPREKNTHLKSFDQWPFQEPKLEVPTIYKAYFSGLCKGISPKIWPKIWY